MKGISQLNSIKRFFTQKKNLPFEAKVMHTFLLIGIIMATIATVFDYFHGFGLLSIGVNLIFVIGWIIIYALLEKYEWTIVASFLLFIFGFYIYSWVMTKGIFDPMPYYALLFVAIMSIVTKRKTRLLLVGAMIGVTVGMTLYDLIRFSTFSQGQIIENLSHLVMVLVIMAFLIIYYSDTYAEEKKKNLAYSKVIEKQSRQQLYYLQHLEEINMQLRSERHDFNNHIGIIYGLIESDENIKAKNYTKELVENAEHYRHIISMPYLTLQAIVNYKLAIARNENIDVKVEVELPRELKINEFDIGIVLGNLIDNSIEALKKVEAKKRYLILKLTYKHSYMLIYIENPYALLVKQKHDQYITIKQDMDNHGYGLSNIKNIVEKYDGILKIDHSDNIFKVDVAILTN